MKEFYNSKKIPRSNNLKITEVILCRDWTEQINLQNWQRVEEIGGYRTLEESGFHCCFGDGVGHMRESTVPSHGKVSSWQPLSKQGQCSVLQWGKLSTVWRVLAYSVPNSRLEFGKFYLSRNLPQSLLNCSWMHEWSQSQTSKCISLL